MADIKGIILDGVQYDLQDTATLAIASEAVNKADTNANSITQLQTDLASANTNITNLQTSVSDVNDTAKNAYEQSQTNKADIATNTSDISTNKSNIATNKANISTNASNISNLQTSVSKKMSKFSNYADSGELTTHRYDIALSKLKSMLGMASSETSYNGYAMVQCITSDENGDYKNQGFFFVTIQNNAITTKNSIEFFGVTTSVVNGSLRFLDANDEATHFYIVPIAQYTL